MNNRTRARHKRTVTKRQDNGSTSVLIAALTGAATGVAVILVLTLLLSAICLASSDPAPLLSPVALGINTVAFFFAGFTGAKRKSAAVPVGALSGTLLALLLWICSFFFGNEFSWDIPLPVELLIRCSFIIISVLGGLLAVNTKIKKRK